GTTGGSPPSPGSPSWSPRCRSTCSATGCGTCWTRASSGADMARVVRCALVQVASDLPMDRPVDEIKAALNDKCARLIETAAARGARMLALPELFNTPYFATATDPRWHAAAEPIPSGPTTALVQELARRHEMVIVAPF